MYTLWIINEYGFFNEKGIRVITDSLVLYVSHVFRLDILALFMKYYLIVFINRLHLVFINCKAVETKHAMTINIRR